MAVVEGNRHPKENLQAGLKTRGLAAYTIRICANPKTFDPKYDRFLTQRLVDKAVDIHTLVWTANSIRTTTHERYMQRGQMQMDARHACDTMLCLIDMAKPVYHLRGDRAKYWSNLVREARTLIDGWMRSDYERYKDLPEGNGNQ